MKYIFKYTYIDGVSVGSDDSLGGIESIRSSSIDSAIDTFVERISTYDLIDSLSVYKEHCELSRSDLTAVAIRNKEDELKRMKELL